MSIVNGFQVGSEVLKYNAEALENYNTPDFDSTSTYEIGDYVMHLGKLYKCIQDITIAGDWDINDWELAVLSNDVKSLVTSITNIDSSIADDFQANHLYLSGDIIMHENILYKCLPTTLQTGSFNPLDWEATTIDYVINNSTDDSIPSGGTENQYLMKNSNTDYDLKWSNLIEGTGNTASGSNSHAEGYNTTASGNYGSHSEGRYTTASGSSSHAEGNNTVASGMHSHAEGSYTTASYDYAHAEGDNTQSSGYSSHAEGSGSIASNTNSHAEGGHTTASGRYAHSEGQHTEANHRSQHVFGEYNVADDSSETANNRGKYVEIVGNGTANNAKSNARTLDWSGNETLTGDLTINKGSANEIAVGMDISTINMKIDNGVAREFSAISSYSAGDVVFYNGSLYRFASSHSGAWSGTDVVLEYNAFRNITRIDSKIENGVAPMFSTATSYNAGDYVYYGSTLYRFKVAHTGAWSASDAEAVSLGDEVSDLKSRFPALPTTNGNYRLELTVSDGTSTMSWVSV